MNSSGNISVSIVEDDTLILSSLKQLIQSSEGFSVVGSHTNAEDALKNLSAELPDVLLLDIDLPGMSGIDAIVKLKKLLPELNIVMLTVHEESELVFSALRQGAVGYLVKGNHSQLLLTGIREVYEGGAPMSPTIARLVIASFKPSFENILSERELEVLHKLSNGTNNRQIADELFVSTNTIKAHIKNIYKKLHVNSRAEAVKKGFREGLF